MVRAIVYVCMLVRVGMWVFIHVFIYVCVNEDVSKQINMCVLNVYVVNKTYTEAFACARGGIG